MPETLERPSLQNNSADGWPSAVDMKVIDAGVVFYEDLRNANGEAVGGNVLVQKAALDRMAASMEGKPIVNWDHRAVKPREFGKGGFQGIITKVYFNSQDGWYHASGYVWDESTRQNIKNGYSISCAYTVSDWGEGGTYHKVPYEREVLDGAYTHIAVVPVPRYEGARIELLNSGGKTMGLLSIFRKDKQDEKVEFDPATTKIPVNGAGDVLLSELMNSYEATHAPQLQDDDLVEVKGKKVKLSELKNAHVQMLLNAELDKLDKEHQNGGHKNKMANCTRCNSAAAHEPTNLNPQVTNAEEEEKKKLEQKNAEEAKKAEEEKKNADEAKKKEDEEKANALKNAAKLDELRNKDRQLPMPKITSLKDLVAEGESRYGTKPVLAAK